MNNIDISPIKRLNENHISKADAVEFSDLNFYIDLAQKLIVSCGNSIRPGIAQEMLNNDDIVANLATELMSAELSFNGRGNIYGYRKQIAKWVVYEYLGRKKKANERTPLSLDAIYSDTEKNLGNIIPSEMEQPDETAIRNESNDNFSTGLGQLIDQGFISETQADCLKMHFMDGMSITDIAKERGYSRQSVSALILRAMEKLRRNPSWLETTTFTGYNT